MRERHHDGWPIMAGPNATADEASTYIDDLLVAGPLAGAANEHGYQYCPH